MAMFLWDAKAVDSPERRNVGSAEVQVAEMNENEMRNLHSDAVEI